MSRARSSGAPWWIGLAWGSLVGFLSGFTVAGMVVVGVLAGG